MTIEVGHKIQIEISPKCRKRLEMIKAIVALSCPQYGTPTWSQCVEFITDVLPIGRMLKDAIDGTQLSPGELNYDAEPTRPDAQPEQPARGSSSSAKSRSDNRAG